MVGYKYAQRCIQFCVLRTGARLGGVAGGGATLPLTSHGKRNVSTEFHQMDKMGPQNAFSATPATNKQPKSEHVDFGDGWTFRKIFKKFHWMAGCRPSHGNFLPWVLFWACHAPTKISPGSTPPRLDPTLRDMGLKNVRSPIMSSFFFKMVTRA